MFVNAINKKELSAINKKELSAVIFLDLRKAFDLVNHELLTKKLEIYGCDSLAVKWFTSYLEDRKQYVLFKKAKSETRDVTVGVPQGSILGPLLFMTYINDLPLTCSKTSIAMYADDSTLHASGKTVTELETKVSEDLESVSKWCNSNRMALNIKKTKSMLITTKQKMCHLEKKNLDICINGDNLQSTECDKLLGVNVDMHLTWKQHVKKVHTTVSRLLHLLWQIRSYLPTDARVTFYKSYVMPHFDFCSCVWGTSTDLPKLQKLQRRAIRLIFNLEKSDSTTKYREDLFLMPLKERNEFRIATMMYKAMNNLTPRYITNLFKYINSVHDRTTRSSVKRNLYVPRATLHAFKNSFAVRGAQVWNNLSLEIRSSKTLNEFKGSYFRKYWNISAN